MDNNLLQNFSAQNNNFKKYIGEINSTMIYGAIIIICGVVIIYCGL